MKVISFKITLFYFLLLPAFTLSGESRFLMAIDDMPLANALTERPNFTVMFETSQGRISFATATGITTFEAVKGFYSKSLPQLGWEIEKTKKRWYYTDSRWVATWYRGLEKLTIELTKKTDLIRANFILTPRHQISQKKEK